MKSIKPILGALAIGLASVGAVGVAVSDSDDHHERGEHDRGHDWGRGWIGSRADVAPVENATYSEECGACHMPYQPGLLPADAWDRIMRPAALSDHYGDDASLSETLAQEILAYLRSNAADRSERVRSRAFGVGAAQAGPGLPRVSETPYFLRKHDEIPARMVVGNPDVGSFSQCNRCHRGADKGVYNDHQVEIPGYGPWDD